MKTTDDARVVLEAVFRNGVPLSTRLPIREKKPRKPSERKQRLNGELVSEETYLYLASYRCDFCGARAGVRRGDSRELHVHVAHIDRCKVAASLAGRITC